MTKEPMTAAKLAEGIEDIMYDLLDTVLGTERIPTQTVVTDKTMQVLMLCSIYIKEREL